jgi:hypothetical protein
MFDRDKPPVSTDMIRSRIDLITPHLSEVFNDFIIIGSPMTSDGDDSSAAPPEIFLSGRLDRLYALSSWTTKQIKGELDIRVDRDNGNEEG